MTSDNDLAKSNQPESSIKSAASKEMLYGQINCCLFSSPFRVRRGCNEREIGFICGAKQSRQSVNFFSLAVLDEKILPFVLNFVSSRAHRP